MAKKVSITRTVRLPAARIFDALTDPAQHPLIDGSGSVRGTHGHPTARLRLGDTFGMDMRLGVPYRITNRVVEYEEGRLIAWRHFAGHRWRWELAPVDEQTTEVTETFDYTTATMPLVLELLGFPERNRKGIQATLDRLETALTDK
jgi:uncharacterized protein YndB with AHSA1/START domain